ncbi:MAG: hypothetical protein HY279_00645 [Nitrospinae bacterium]|nr:hypothetical protein [Nitrospinota bacterium]
MAQGKVSSISDAVIRQSLAVKRDGKTVEAKRSHNFPNPQKEIRVNIKEKTAQIAVGLEKGNKINAYA